MARAFFKMDEADIIGAIFNRRIDGSFGREAADFDFGFHVRAISAAIHVRHPELVSGSLEPMRYLKGA
jgi:hypothetical protein